MQTCEKIYLHFFDNLTKMMELILGSRSMIHQFARSGFAWKLLDPQSYEKYMKNYYEYNRVETFIRTATKLKIVMTVLGLKNIHFRIFAILVFQDKVHIWGVDKRTAKEREADIEHFWRTFLLKAKFFWPFIVKPDKISS